MALSATAVAPVRATQRAASAPRVLASSHPAARATSAPRRTEGREEEEEEEDGVTIDDGDGDGGEEVLLAMGNAINNWGRDKGKGLSRAAAGVAKNASAAPAPGAVESLSTSVMAQMGLLPDSMLQRTLQLLLAKPLLY